MKNKTVQTIWLAALLLTPFVLWLLPSDFFDNTGIEICPSKFLFDFECLGCGMTRAVMHLHHFELEDAIFFNRASVLVYPGLIAVWFVWVKDALKETGLWSKLNFKN